MATYGDFRAFLAKNGIKQKEVAELLNITEQTLSTKMSGAQEFTLPQIRILCEHYGLSADIFLA